MKTKISLLTLLIALLMACKLPKNKVDSKNSSTSLKIENIKWILTSINGKTNLDVSTSEEIYFNLNTTKDRISGYTGCNTFMGSYTLGAQNGLSISQIASTRKMCAENSIPETVIINLFNKVHNFVIIDNKLTFKDVKNNSLASFRKTIVVGENTIREKYWRLKKLDGKAIKMATQQTREIYFTLKRDNTVIGFAGCNAIAGAYNLAEDSSITFFDMATTLKFCSDIVFNESDFLKMFQLANSYKIANDILYIHNAKNKPIAVFEAIYMQ